MQLLTVAEILEGKRFLTSTVAGRHEPQPRLSGVTGWHSKAINLSFHSVSQQLKAHTIVRYQE